ncbi:MAG: AAA family ATPase [Candidatus Gastranaerophilales bacterium]|nr:AAA family ATPase [Candidatus Gastranaerophilales bacterium]
MTVSIALTGKSGSGKTTLTKALLFNLRLKYPNSLFLVVDNDLTTEFGHTYNKDIRQTVYGIRSGKHEYKTGIPSQMTKQEYIEWALEDIIFPLEENTDLLVTWLSPSKDCRCPVTAQMNNALLKLFDRYDFVLFDCEYDLKYLQQLVDYQIDSTLIVTRPTEESVNLAYRIQESSEKYAEGQLGVVLNMVKGNITENISAKLNHYGLKVLGNLNYDEALELNGTRKYSNKFNKEVNDIILRLNLPIMGYENG